MGGGDCWTCCLKEPQEVIKASKSLASGPPCIPMCFDAPPKQCLFGSVSFLLATLIAGVLIFVFSILNSLARIVGHAVAAQLDQCPQWR